MAALVSTFWSFRRQYVGWESQHIHVVIAAGVLPGLDLAARVPIPFYGSVTMVCTSLDSPFKFWVASDELSSWVDTLAHPSSWTPATTTACFKLRALAKVKMSSVKRGVSSLELDTLYQGPIGIYHRIPDLIDTIIDFLGRIATQPLGSELNY